MAGGGLFTGSPQPAAARGEQWWLAHQRALKEARRDDLDGNESAPYGLSVLANPKTLQMRGWGKGTGGRGTQNEEAQAWNRRRVPWWVHQGSLAQTQLSLPCVALEKEQLLHSNQLVSPCPSFCLSFTYLLLISIFLSLYLPGLLLPYSQQGLCYFVFP